MAGSEEGAAPEARRGAWTLWLGAALAVAASAALLHWGMPEEQDPRAFAPASGTIRLVDLPAPIEVLRDSRGIPHLRATAERAGWLGLGFVHAQDRLAQMTWLRRRALGRASEIVGEAALPADRLARLLEIGPSAERSVASLPPASREALDAYAEGVNARIARIRQGRVPPPAALPVAIDALEPWRPEDSVAVVKLLSWCIGGTLETTLVLDALIQRLESVPARPFFPSGASVDFGLARRLPRGEAKRTPAFRTLTGLASQEPTRRLCHGLGTPTGSAFVIAGSAAEGRRPMLVADWHGAPAVPALFYEAHLEAGALDVAGATIPGSPLFWIGRNPSVAWAAIPAGAPVSDLFLETLREDRGVYRDGRRWTPLESRVETISVRDPQSGSRAEALSIRRTRHGPLIESLLDHDATGEDGDGEASESVTPTARALSWSGARPGDGVTSMLGVARASSAQALLEALEEHHEPVVAVTYAARSGEAGVQVAGWLPKRPLPTGLVPVQGRLRSFDWRARVPLAELPGERLARNATAPWVIAADQRWSGRGGLDQMEWLWRPGQRAARLAEAIAAATVEGRIGIREAAALLGDTRSRRAPRVVAGLLALARSGGTLPLEAQEIARLLERWDGSMHAREAGAAAYQLVLGELIEALLREPFDAQLLDLYLRAPHVRPQLAIESLVLRAARLRREGGWIDEARVSAAARESLRRVWVALAHRLGPTRERWAWGELLRLRFVPWRPDSTTGGVPAPSSWIGGSTQTLAYARHPVGLSFDVAETTTYRAAIDLSSQDHLLSALMPGQSEHPGHPHHADGLARSSADRLPLFATDRMVIEEENPDRLLLEPSP